MQILTRINSFWVLVATVALAALPAMAEAQIIKSYTPVLTGGTLVDFEGFSEGTLIDTQYAGVTFDQAPLSGRPMIDNYSWLFGYGSSSGEAVLTGSTEGGYSFPTVAGIVAKFSSPVSTVQVFFSDTSPLGDYTISAFDTGGALIDSFVVLSSEVLPPGYSGGFFPPPGTFPLPGIYVGFMHAVADIARIQIGPSSGFDDAFAIDDLRFVGTAVVPEPGVLSLLLGCSVAATLALLRRRRR